MRELQQAVRHLTRTNGSADIVIVDGRIYEISARELDTDTVRQAVRNLIEERSNDTNSE